MNKIYMTYKKSVPSKVFKRWEKLNPNYKIEFSLDNDCINFLRENFNDYVANLFISIPKGMYKADLWRLCKLYMNGGVYADVDLVPHFKLDKLNKDITFYSCLSIIKNSVFQAFMVNFSKPKNPLIFIFLLSFLINNPYTYHIGPTFDMYNCIKYNTGTDIKKNKKYNLNEVKIKINIGSSETNTKNIDLHYFPNTIQYTIRLHQHPYNDTFEFNILNNILTVKRKDEEIGWGYEHSIDICIESKESILLFQEYTGPNNNWVQSHVDYKGKKLLDSRDQEYYINKGW